MNFTIGEGNAAYNFSANGDVQRMELNDNMVMLRGPLYGTIMLDNDEYLFSAGFTKMEESDDINIGLVITSSDFTYQKMYSFGTFVMTDSIHNAWLEFKSQTEKTTINNPQMQSPQAANVSGDYTYVGTDYGEIGPAPETSLTGDGVRIDAFVENEDKKVMLTLSSYCDRFDSSSFINGTFVSAYTANTFPFVKKTNHGEVDQYYIENTHPAIISRETFDKVQNLLKKRAERRPSSRQRTPLSLKVICGNCGSVYMRRVNKSGHTTWVCRKHDRNAIDCPNGRVPETELYAAFARMYNKLKHNTGVVLLPAIKQMEELRDVIQRGNPAMLAVNKAIAKASEQSYNISKLQTAGLLDTDACTAKFNEISAQLAKLRAERRRLLENDDIDDAIDALQETVDLVRHGPERLMEFDEGLFLSLVERIVVESQTCVRFRLQGGIELKELLKEIGR